MKLILLHGSAQAAISKKMSSIKEDFEPLSITEISGNSSALDFSSQSLFSEKRLVILENPDIKTVESAVTFTDPDLTILIRFAKSLEKSSAILKKIIEAKGEILLFDEAQETSIFPLLDMLGSKDAKAFSVFEKNYSQFGGQYLLTMLAYFLCRMVQKSQTRLRFYETKN